MSDTDAQTPRPPKQRVKRKRQGVGFGTVFSLVVAGIVFFILFISLSGRTVPVPETLRSTIEDRVNARYEGAPLSLGGMRFGVGRDGVPQVMMDDILIADPNGGGVAQLNRLGANLSLGRLFRGEIAASNLLLAGAQITIRRTADGSFAFRSDQSTETEAETLPELLAKLDQLMDRSAFSTLSEVFAGGIVLTLEDARSGRIWQATNATAVLRKSDDALSVSITSDVFNGTDSIAEMQLSVSRSRVTGHVSLGVQVSNMAASDIARQSPVVSWLSVLDAPISGSVRTELNAAGELESFAGTLDIQGGALKPDDEVLPIEFDAAQAYFTFDPTRQRIDFSQLRFRGASGELQATGHAYLSELNGPWPSAFLGQFQADQFVFSGEGIFPAPVEFGDIRADLRLRLDPFTAEIAQIAIDNDGTPVTASGRVEARDGGWHASLDATSSDISAERVMQLWPLIVSPISRAWLAENLIDGHLYNPAAGLRLEPGKKPDIALSFEIEDGSTRFLPDMPNLEQVKAAVTMLDFGFTLALKEGGVTAGTGDWVDASGSVFKVADVRPKPAWGEIEVVAKAPLTAALTVLNNEPLRIMERAEQPTDLAEANADARAIVRLPLVKEIPEEDLFYDVTARMTDVRSDRLVEDRVFTSRLLELKASTDEISINGNARLDGVPLTANWRQPFGEEAVNGGRIEGQVALSPQTLAAFDIPLPDGFVGGQATASYDLKLPTDGAPQLALVSDLAGLTLDVPSVGYRKVPAATGEMRAEIELGDEPDVRTFKLATDGLSLDGDLDFSDAGFRAATFEKVEIQDWLDATVELRPDGNGTSVSITGGTLDLRNLETGSGGDGSAGAGTFNVNLDRLIVSDSVTLTPIQGSIEQSRFGLSGEFRARVNGGASIRGVLTPANGGTAIRVQSPDAARVLRDAALTPNAREGTLDVVLTPVPGARSGTYDGQFLIENIRMRKAPVMADLLDAISVVGLLDQLNGPGIRFASIDGRFRLTPRRLQILEAAAVGPSMGVSADGIYDFDRKALDVRGVISPVYFLNGIGSIFTRRGEGLFGFNYRVAGGVDNPRVGVNPLSILTPGMFRRIFRAAPPRG